MNRELAEKVADAVMYEGYMLYPYRPSALKNQQRWSFGTLYPPAYDEVRLGTERSEMRTECLVFARDEAVVHIQLRFLQPGTASDGGQGSVPRSVEHDLVVATGHTFQVPFAFAELKGSLTCAAEQVADNILKLKLETRNESEMTGAAENRGDAIAASLLSAHIILSVTGGEFVSLLDPPPELANAAASCCNVGNFPVLVGNAGERDIMLCSPILLYDYPQIAPESVGDFFDATEIDEMLTLRLLTLTEQEKGEMRSADERTRELLERTERTAREQLARTHGTVRNLHRSDEQR